MTVAAIVIAPAERPSGRGRAASRRGAGPSLVAEAASARAALEAGYDEVVVVLADATKAGLFPSEATVLQDESEHGSLHSALDWCSRAAHEAIVVALDRPVAPVGGASNEGDVWRALLKGGSTPITVATVRGRRANLVRVEVEVWPLVPLEGGLTQMLATRTELVSEVDVAGNAAEDGSAPVARAAVGAVRESATPADIAAVTELLGRPPAGRFSVVVRDLDGTPVVIRNAPLLNDDTPMPTRYWLVGRREREAVGRLESAGGVDRAESEIDPVLLAAAHDRYAEERDAAIPETYTGPRPTGGVGGTRIGVKCLHAHLAWYLAGGGDPVGRWVVTELNGLLAGPVAAIDCGTNSTRLLVVDRDGSTLTRLMTITRLGRGVDQTHALAEESIARTVEVLEGYRTACDRFGVVALRATATSAARDASNSAAFFDAAEAALGVRPELLSGEEEGRLSYLGATRGLEAAEGPYLVCDLGGGSTELVVGGPGAPGSPLRGIASLDVGCVRITERFLVSDPPSAGELAAARAYVADALSAVLLDRPGLGGPKAMVGVAGTVSALVGLSLGLEHHDRATLHHQRLARATVEGLIVELSSMPVATRRETPGLEPERADVIVGGALVLAEVMTRLGHDELIYSEDDLLDGIAESLSEGQRA